MNERDIDLSALVAGGSARALRLHGTRLGGRIEDIPSDALQPSGDREMALSLGGWIRGKGVHWHAEGGRLTRISVFQPHVAQLGITRETDIVSTFGDTRLVERRGGLVTYHYSSRSFAVTWDRDRQGVAAVLLGEVEFQERSYDALFLVRLLARYGGVIDLRPPDPLQQPFEHFDHRRAEALARAFSLGSLEDALTGRFVRDREPGAYAPVIERLRTFEGSPGEMPFPLREVESLYRDLLRFRHITRISPIHAGAMEMGSLNRRFSYRLTRQAVDAIRPHLDEIDGILAQIIDPEGRGVLEDDLVDHFSFPLDPPEMDE